MADVAQGFERREYQADRVRPRRTSFSFPLDTPRYWVNGNVAKTHFLNSLHAFLPPFERMITRLVRDKVLPHLTDPALIEQARGFMGQESIHGRSHALFCDVLRHQGYALDTHERAARWVFDDLFERYLGTKISVSMIAAFEHYTDLLVAIILRSDFLDGADPRVAELYRWHAAEEVEHNAVAFEMLKALGGGEVTRMAGNVLGVAVIYGFLLGGTVMFLAQDKKLTDREVIRDLLDILVGKYRIVQDTVALFAHYARPDYHPTDADYSALANEVLAPA